MNLTVKNLFRPDLFPALLCVIAAFGISLFFEGYRDLHYAPAALSLLVFACIGIIPSFWRGLSVPSGAAALIFFALWLYVTLSLSWSTVPFASLVTYLIFIATPLTFFTLLLTRDREEWLTIIAGTLFAGLAVLAAWAIIQYLFLSGTYGDRAHHPLPNPNNLAGLMTLGLLPALALFLRAEAKSKLFYAGLALSLLFAGGLVATESRGGILSAAIASIVLIFSLRSGGTKDKRLLVFVGLGLLVLFALSLKTGLRLPMRLGELFSLGSDYTAAARIAIWENTLAMVQDYWLAGAGFGTFYLYYPHYRLPGADNSLGHWAHMDPLQYWAEMGIIAPVLFYALCIAILGRTIKAVKNADKASANYAVMMGFFCALLGLIIHTHATFHLYLMPILIVLGTWLALWYHMSGKILGDDARSFTPVAMTDWQKPFMGVVTISIAVLISIMAVSSALGQYHLLRAHELIKQGLTVQFTNEIAEAEKWAPRSFIDSEVQLAALYIDLLGKNSAALFSDEEQQSLFIETNELLNAASQMNPAWAEIDYKRGLLNAAVNTGFAPEAREVAIKAFEAAVQKDPQHFKARQELALAYIGRGRVKDAYELLEYGLRYPHPPLVETSYRNIMSGIQGLVDIQRGYEQGQKKEPQSETQEEKE